MSTLCTINFSPPNFQNTTLLVHIPHIGPLSSPQLRLCISKYTQYGSVQLSSPFFFRQTGVPSTTPFTAELDSLQRCLSSFVNSTLALVGLSGAQVEAYTLGDLKALSSSEQALILLLCSTLYAVSNIGQAMQQLH